MKQLGYTEAGGMYVHNFSPFTVEFPVGPLGIGDDLINSWSTFARDSELLHIVSATDCVRDRLAHFYYWNDYSALDAAVAVAVAQNNEIDLDAIRAWTLREGAVHVKKLTTFEERFSKAIRAG